MVTREASPWRQVGVASRQDGAVMEGLAKTSASDLEQLISVVCVLLCSINTSRFGVVASVLATLL